MTCTVVFIFTVFASHNLYFGALVVTLAMLLCLVNCRLLLLLCAFDTHIKRLPTYLLIYVLHRRTQCNTVIAVT